MKYRKIQGVNKVFKKNTVAGVVDIEGLQKGFDELIARSCMPDDKDEWGQYTNLMTGCMFAGYVNGWRDFEIKTIKEQVKKIASMMNPFSNRVHIVFNNHVILNLKTGEKKHVSQDYEITDQEAEALDFEFKTKIIHIINHFGGLEQAENAVAHWVSDLIVDDVVLTQEDVQQAIYGYKLTGLDNPFDLTITQIEQAIEELEKTISNMGNLGDDSMFSFAYVSMNFKHKTSYREVDYDLRDFNHILSVLRAKNSTAKSVTE